MTGIIAKSEKEVGVFKELRFSAFAHRREALSYIITGASKDVKRLQTVEVSLTFARHRRDARPGVSTGYPFPIAIYRGVFTANVRLFKMGYSLVIRDKIIERRNFSQNFPEI